MSLVQTKARHTRTSETATRAFPLAGTWTTRIERCRKSMCANLIPPSDFLIERAGDLTFLYYALFITGSLRRIRNDNMCVCGDT